MNSARLAARYLSQQGKPWDLMAWSFARPSNGALRSQKSAVQLQRDDEASAPIPRDRPHMSDVAEEMMLRAKGDLLDLRGEIG